MMFCPTFMKFSCTDEFFMYTTLVVKTYYKLDIGGSFVIDFIDKNEEKLKTLILCLGFIYGTQFLYLIVAMIINLYGMNKDIHILEGPAIPLMLSFLFPGLCINHFILKTKYSIDYKVIILFFLVSAVCLYYFRIELILLVNTAMVAISEEFIYRDVIQSYLNKYFSFILTVIIVSLTFALCNHSSYSIMDNLLYRFPMSLVLSVVAQKYGLGWTILLHYIHNLSCI